MKNNITSLEINNFKSIKDLKLDCKRINIFIGEPNVGKSNILEALSLYIAGVSDYSKLFLKDYIRYEKLSNLFYDQDRKNKISVKSNIGSAYFRFHMNSINSYDIALIPPDANELDFLDDDTSTVSIENDFYEYFNSNKNKFDSFSLQPFYFTVSDNDQRNFPRNQLLKYASPIKRYIFKSLSKHESHFPLFLSPPHGNNLYTILESNPQIYNEAAQFFNKYKLDLLIDTETEKLDVQKRVGNRVYKIPFSLSADTLQRIIFHIAAIETNTDSILLFEEPEAHSFPKYISLIAEKIVQNKENQFFVATHSPYLLTTFIEECNEDDIAIFICTYENYETKVRALSDKEIGNIMETGIDLYYNLPAFEK